MGFFHSYKDGVDYVFVDHPCFTTKGKDIYSGERLEILFRCTLLCKVTHTHARMRARMRIWGRAGVGWGGETKAERLGPVDMHA